VKLALLLGSRRVTCALACLAVIWAPACNGDDSGAGGGSTVGTGGSTSGSTSATGGSTSSAAGGAGGAATGGAGGTGGSEPDPFAGEYNHECLLDSPECLGGWVCKTGVCDFCLDNTDCPNDDCNTTTFRCAAHDLCAVETDCPSNSFCDSGSCVFDHPSQGTCGVDALYFAHDTSSLTPTYAARLSGALSCLVGQINGGATLTLDVFSDNIGSPGYNLPLTELRGNSLKNFLVSQGANTAGIVVVAFGATQSSGIFEADRAADRRVAFNWN
jgi:OmpA family